MAMNDENRKNPGKKTGADEAPVENGSEAENTGTISFGSRDNDDSAKDDATADPVQLLEQENEDLKDRYIRLAAEMENLRRRTARDVKDARAYAIANFARDMLAVSDNMQRALEAIPSDARRSEDTGYKALIEGVELTERDMLAALERHGVRKLEPQGEKFDPHFHQAMFEVPNTEVPHNSVFQVVQAGYVIGERVLRPAMVGVAKGGPKTPPGEASTVDDKGGAESTGKQGGGSGTEEKTATQDSNTGS